MHMTLRCAYDPKPLKNSKDQNEKAVKVVALDEKLDQVLNLLQK